MQERMTAAQYRETLQKPLKYRNKKTVVNGIEFASRKEARRYAELLILQKVGDIINLECQKRYLLQPAFTKDRKKFRAITYIADFYYQDRQGREIVEDTKGVKTAEFMLKAKLFEMRYPNLTIRLL